MWILYTVISALILISLLILFVVHPGRRRDRTPFDKTLYAHRGLHSNDGQYPENSLSAFRLAREAGYGVELDIQLTADRKVVVFHDELLSRVTGKDGYLRNLKAENLKYLKIVEKFLQYAPFVFFRKILPFMRSAASKFRIGPSCMQYCVIQNY